MRSRYLILLVLLALLPFVTGCSTTANPPSEPALVAIPAGFPPLPVPSSNALTADRIALGKRLFYDKQLSRTREVACGSCHLQENSFADPRRFSLGVEGRIGKRNAPPLMNMAYNTSFFWDGGVPTLEQQVIGPVTNPLEMDMSLEDVAERLKGDPTYVSMFQKAYSQAPAPEWITKAIASFERTFVSGHSRYDKFNAGGTDALTREEKHGMDLFFSETADCFHCHIGFNFTNESFQNNGLYAVYADSGRMLITEQARDRGKFKVPSLRNIALTAPYMHDGSLATLEEVVEHYNKGGNGNPNSDPVIRQLGLSAEEKADLIAFLRALTDDEFINNPSFKE